MKNLTVLGVAAFALAALSGGRAQGELIELTNGQVLQGDVREGQTTEEGLAVNVYETGGVVVVRWDHIVTTQRKEFRLKLGIDLPDESVELVPGHSVLLASGEKVQGFAENPRVMAERLRMKTRTGVKEYDRASLQGPVEDAQIDGLIVYTVEELYQKIRDERPPEMPADHKQLAMRCMNFGAYDHAREHLLAAKTSDVFMATDEGKAVEQMLRVCDLMIRAKGASDLVTQIRQAMSGSRWNDALKLFDQLDKEYKDESIRKAVNYELLETRVTKGRNDYFQKEICRVVFKLMNQLIDKKAHERKPSREADDAGAKPGTATPGTLAAARQWESRDLDTQLWDKVAQDLGLKQDEIDKFWKARSDKRIHKDGYGSGSFIVVTRASGAKAGTPPAPQRRPPGADRKKSGGKTNAPKAPEKVEKPLTEEEWWDSIQSGEKASWLAANFAERSGHFEILGTPQVNCENCTGTGFTRSAGTDGGEEQHFCKQCNGCGLVRWVNYR